MDLIQSKYDLESKLEQLNQEIIHLQKQQRQLEHEFYTSFVKKYPKLYYIHHTPNSYASPKEYYYTDKNEYDKWEKHSGSYPYTSKYIISSNIEKNIIIKHFFK